VADYYKSSLVNNFLFENYCKIEDRWGSKHDALLEKVIKVKTGKETETSMKEIMHNAVMDMCSPYLPKSFLDAKMEAEREKKLFASVVDLDDRVNEKMHSVFWSDEGISVIEKFDKKKRQKEKRFNVGPSLEVNREEEQEKDQKIVENYAFSCKSFQILP
jgi:hypothetical protein